MKRILVLGALVATTAAIPMANAQTYSKTETIEYHDDTTLWVLNQVSRTTTNNVETSRTEFGWKALPWKTYQFGRLVDTYSYDSTSAIGSGQLGKLKTVADGNNNAIMASDWKRGIPRLIKFPVTPESPSGATQSAVVDDNGWITSVMDENGHRTCYDYDPMGRVSKITYPSNAKIYPEICNEFPWNAATIAFQQITSDEHGLPAGHWRQSRYQGNKHVNTYYDAMWRPVLEEQLDYVNIAGTLSQTVKRYDANGRLSFQSYPTTNVGDFNSITQGARTTYDALGRVTRVEQDSELGIIASTTEYLTGFQTRATNPRGFQVTTEYQAYDQPTTDFPAGITTSADTATEIHRDAFYKPTLLVRRNHANTQRAERRYVYDGYQQLCKVIEPETGATVMDYDSVGNLAWSASGLTGSNYADPVQCSRNEGATSGRAAVWQYDSRNRPTNLFFPDHRGDQSWTYTPDSLVATAATDNEGSALGRVNNAYTYNKRRMLTGESVDQPGWYTWSIGYGYDANGSLASQTYPTGLAINYAPNALGQATQAGNYATDVQYYPNGGIKQFTYGNGLVHTMSQNTRQLPSRVVDSGNTMDYEYGYDKNANVSVIYDNVLGTPTPQTRWMGYDGLDRLRWTSSVMFGGGQQFNYTYDALDNLKSAKLEMVKDYANYVYDPTTNQLTNIKDSNGATIVGLSYDAQGNLANKSGQQYIFDFGNRLREVSNKESYRYDSRGRRVQTTKIDGSKTLWQYDQSGQMLFSWNGPIGETTHENVYLGGSLIATIDHEWPSNTIIATKYQHTDALGSPVAVTNAAGTLIERTNYEPYGAALNEPIYDGIGYAGHVMDGATGLTYMQQRYYDPMVGRFLSVDPVAAYENPVGAFNRYWYANNNPYRFSDPDGRQVAEKIREVVLPTSAELVERGESGTTTTNTLGALKQVGNTMLQSAFLTSDPIGTILRGGAPQIPIHNNELEGAAAAELGVAVLGALTGGGGTGAGIARSGSGLADDGARVLAGSGKKWIYSARELLRRASEPGPHHNFPESFNSHIFSGNREVISRNYILYTRTGILNGKAGSFEIGVKPSPSGRTEVITHRFFRPDK